MGVEVRAEELQDVPTGKTEVSVNPGGSPRKPPQKRHAERFDIGTPDHPQARIREGLDDRPVQSSEARTRDDVIGPRTPAAKRQTDTFESATCLFSSAMLVGGPRNRIPTSSLAFMRGSAPSPQTF